MHGWGAEQAASQYSMESQHRQACTLRLCRGLNTMPKYLYAFGTHSIAQRAITGILDSVH